MMKNRTAILNTILAVVLGVVLLVSIIAKMMCPQLILPQLNIPYVAAVSLVALILASFVKTEEEGCVIAQILLAAVTFGVLPMVAGMVSGAAVLKLALCGGIVFGILEAMFTAMVKRMEMAGICKYAVVPAAFALYLACQCFTGIIL